MLTSRDQQGLTDAFRLVRTTPESIDALRLVAIAQADHLANISPKFNRHAFLSDCGLFENMPPARTIGQLVILARFADNGAASVTGNGITLECHARGPQVNFFRPNGKISRDMAEALLIEITHGNPATKGKAQ